MANSRSKSRSGASRQRAGSTVMSPPRRRPSGRRQSRSFAERAISAVRLPAVSERVQALPIPRELAGVFAAESPVWVALLLVVPILVIGFALTVGWRLNVLPFVDNDYWWHVATGNWILDHHRVPTSDPFSWTYPGTNWVAHEWLAEVIMALLVRAGGFATAIVFTWIVAVAGFWRLLAGVRFYGMSRRAACLLMLLWGGSFLRPGVLVPRPQVWTWALLCVLLAELAAYETGRRRVLWAIPLLFVLWVNLNLTVLIGILCLGVFAFDRLLHGRLDRHLLTVSVLSLVALLVNPRGPELLRWAFKYADPNAVRYSVILEWKPPTLGDHSFIPFWLALPMVPLAVWPLLRWRPRVWPGALVFIFCAEALKAIRYIPVYAIVAFLFAGWLVWFRAQTREQRPAAANVPLVPFRPWVYPLPVAAATLVLVIALVHSPSQFRHTPIPVGLPVSSTTTLLQDYPSLIQRDGHIRLYNTYDYGGYLIYRFQDTPEVRVFIDGREEMYGDPFLRKYLALEDGRPGWQGTFDQLGINAAIVRRGDGIFNEMVNDPVWRPVAQDPRAVLFVYSPK